MTSTLFTYASNNFNTYVVNLEKDYSNYINIKKKLAFIGYHHVFRFEAVNGYSYVTSGNHTLDHKITSFCRKFCPYEVIGCGLSHLILTEYIYNNDINKYALILEDDASPIYANIGVDFISAIHEIVDNAPSDWDILKLHCHFHCKYNVSTPTYELGYYHGSNTAYLISKDAIKKEFEFGQNKLFWHFDDQRWIYSRFHLNHLNMYKAPKQLFDADNTHSYTTKPEDGNFLETVADFFINLFGEAQNLNDYKPSNIKVWRLFGSTLSADDVQSILSAVFVGIYALIYRKVYCLSWIYTGILTVASYFGFSVMLYIIFIYDPYVIVANITGCIFITAICIILKKRNTVVYDASLIKNNKSE
eukprot:352491_1